MIKNLADYIRKIAFYGLEWFGRYYSNYPAIVANIEDPQKRGRVKVMSRGLFGANVSDWCEPMGLFAGKDICFFALPNVGDTVWLSFKNGNIQYPVWQYGLWVNGQLPEEVTENYGDSVFIKTTAGLILEFNDKNAYIRIKHPSGLNIELNEKNISLGAETESAHKAVFGDILKPQLDNLNANHNALVAALTGAAVVTGDGGASLKTTTLSAYNAAKQNVDFSGINSDKVTLE